MREGEDPSPGPWLATEETLPLWEAIAETGTIACVMHGKSELARLAPLLTRFPALRVVIDHLNNPVPAEGTGQPIFTDLLALARFPNVFVKLGGLGQLVNGFGWFERPTPPGSAELAEVMAPYYNYCIEKFGVNRCMFESNFPVDRTSYSYTVIWNAFKRIAKDFSPSEKAALFHDTAANTYRLAP